MKFIKLTIIALVGLLITTTSCEKEEPKPVLPTHLGVWELTSVRESYYENFKIVSEETEYMDSTVDGIERIHFKDASNGIWTFIYPNNEEPQDTYPFTYKMEGTKLSITDSDGDYVFEEVNIQAKTLTMAVYEEGSATDPDRLVIYLTFKRM